MSNGSIMKRQRAKTTDRRDGLPCRSTVHVLPTSPRPTCEGCCRPMVLVTCRCHPHTGRAWQCPNAEIKPGMVLVPLPAPDTFADLQPTPPPTAPA